MRKKVTRALEAPDKINIFSSSMSWIFQPSQCFVNIAICKMAMKCHEDGRRNILSIVFAGDSARHHFQNFFFLTRFVLVLIFAVLWQSCWEVQEKMRQRNISHVGKCKRRSGSVTSNMLASAREDAAA